MRRGRLIIILALILIVGLGAVLVFGRSFLFPQTAIETTTVGEQATPVPTQATVKVVVVTQKVQRGELIPEEKLDTVDYPLDMVLPIMITNKDDVKNKVARYDLDAYTVLTTNLVADAVDKAQGSDAALLIEPGMVAVSIPITRLSAVSYAPQRGDKVDVIATLLMVDLDTAWQSRLPNIAGAVIAPGSSAFALTDAWLSQTGVSGASSAFYTAEGLKSMLAQPVYGSSPFGRTETDQTLDEALYAEPSEYQRPRLVSQTIIRGVMVLQMGNFELQTKQQPTEIPPVEVTPTEAQPNQNPTPVPTETPPPPPDVITLVVSPQDAVTLNYLIYSGAQLTLALRHPLDTNTDPTEAVTLQFLLDTYNIPVPVKLPYGLEPRIDALTPPKLTGDVTATPTP